MISGRGKIAGVMGWPVGHSLSPALHGYWLERYGIDGAYIPMAVRPENLEPALRTLSVLGMRGCNLTLPHKEAAFAIVDRHDETAQATGAVNTVVVETNGALMGMNTDVFGFAENLREGLRTPSPRRGEGLHEGEGKHALILGAGGAAPAIVAALRQLGIKGISIANRTRERAEALADRMKGDFPEIKIVDWKEREEALSGIDLLINATSLGLQGQPALELRLDALPLSAVVTDIIYAPLQTKLLKVAVARGNKTIDGLGMLAHQARPGFAAWFGVEPEVTDGVRRQLLAWSADR